MHTNPAATDNRNIQAEILEAAESRFSHYGYRKTTMAEIARDVGMSAANLYRYFENKLDLMSACAERCAADRMQKLGAIVEDPEHGAREKLTRYALASLHFSHELAVKNDKINELVEDITSRNPEIIHQRIQRELVLITRILEEGKARGEFSIDNMEETARAVHTALVVFDVPLFMGLYPLEEFEEMARAITRLIAAGIEKR